MDVNVAANRTVYIKGGRPLVGKVEPPADKSILHRYLMLAGVAKGKSHISATRYGQDNRSTAKALSALGVFVRECFDEDENSSGFVLDSPGADAFVEPKEAIDCGNSGTTMRLLSGLLCGSRSAIVVSLQGDDSLNKRPMRRICKPLRHLGAHIKGKEGNGEEEIAPLLIESSHFLGGNYVSPIASAQVKSALLLGGLCSGQRVCVEEPVLSRDHTERLLTALGIAISTEGSRIELAQATSDLSSQLIGFDGKVAADVSSACFLACAAACLPGSDVLLLNTGVNPTRIGFFEVLSKLGCAPLQENYRETLGEPVADLRLQSLKGRGIKQDPLVLSGAIIPTLIDELVVLAALAAMTRGIEVRGAGELRVKESDRIVETAKLLRAFSLEIEERTDGFYIEGGQIPVATHVDVSVDHRIALTAAVLALCAQGESRLDGFAIADVSYPGFCDDLRMLGALIR